MSTRAPCCAGAIPMFTLSSRATSFSLLATFLLSAFAPSAYATITFVQANSGTPAGSVSTASATFASAQSSGNLNVVAIGGTDSTQSVLSVTDSAGDTYAAATSMLVVPGSRSHVLYYAKNIAAASSNTITVTFNGSVPNADVRILEYSGLDTSNPLDVSAGASGTGTALDSGSLTTNGASELLVAADDVQHAIVAAGTGFTQRVYTGDADTAEDEIVSSSGSYNATATQDYSGVWILQMAAFKAPGGGGGDTQSPSAPGSLSATAASSNQINLSWSASSDNVGVTGYRIERCQGASCSTFAQIAALASASYSDTGLSPSTSYTYRVRATDAAGNLSSYSSTATASTPAGSGISFVQGAYTDPTSTQSSVAVTFAGAQGAGDLNVVAIGWQDSTNSVLSVSDTSGNTYAVAASPVVLSGSRSQVMYYAKNIAGASAGTNVVTVTFSAAVDSADVRILEYSGIDPNSPLDISVGASGTGSALDSGTATTSSANELLVTANDVEHSIASAGSSFTQRLSTLDGDDTEDQVVASAGNYNGTATQYGSGDWIMQLAAFKAASSGGGDTQAPTAPSSLSLTVASSSEIDLSWAASTDNVGVTQYLIERCAGASCTTFFQVGTATGVSFTDTGLSASTSYTYRVRAKDAAGNASTYSSAATASTSSGGGGGGGGDAQAPSAPSGLGGTTISGTQINLSWTASTDDVGVTGYLIERCLGSSCTSFAEVGNSPGTSFSDTGLTTSTSYTYRVRATDAAGNLSAYSSSVTVTTSTVGNICD
jgi:chitodextrinase